MAEQFGAPAHLQSRGRPPPPLPLSMLSSVNRDHWNERLNFTGSAMILKPFPPVVILIIFFSILKSDYQNPGSKHKNAKKELGKSQLPSHDELMLGQ